MCGHLWRSESTRHFCLIGPINSHPALWRCAFVAQKYFHSSRLSTYPSLASRTIFHTLALAPDPPYSIYNAQFNQCAREMHNESPVRHRAHDAREAHSVYEIHTEADH